MYLLHYTIVQEEDWLENMHLSGTKEQNKVQIFIYLLISVQPTAKFQT